MIQSKQDYLYYLNADRIALGISAKPGFLKKFKALFFPDYIWEFQKSLRKLEYYANTPSGFVKKIRKFFVLRRYRRLSYKLGFSIPINVFGPGLSIAHYGTIVVNPAARVGANCRLHVGVNIGTEAGYAGRAPQIGNNCYIGPGAVMYGEISIADNVAVGANAVVNKSVAESNISVAGAPAKKIGEVPNIRDLIIPAAELASTTIDSEILHGKSAKEVNVILQEFEISLENAK